MSFSRRSKTPDKRETTGSPVHTGLALFEDALSFLFHGLKRFSLKVLPANGLPHCEIRVVGCEGEQIGSARSIPIVKLVRPY